MQADEQRVQELFRLEEDLWDRGFHRVAGVDEAGRGPLAGPVVAAAVVFDRVTLLAGLNDSKKVAPARRVWLAGEIRQKAVAWSVAAASARLIDRRNILQATYVAMRRAIRKLGVSVDYVLVDGFSIPDLDVPQLGITSGDRLSASVAAASILAKVTRDTIMEKVDGLYPGYGFARHKGYPTRQHQEALRQLGACPLHRVSFRPVKEKWEVRGRR